MSKAEAFEAKFAGNRSINVEVNFSKGDAIKVPVNINSMDADVIAKKIADQLQLPEIDTTELAKQGENADATNSKILEEVGKIPNIARLYTAYAVKNDDGENTYSIVLPVSADIINGTTIKLQ